MTYLEARSSYKERYDRITVELCRDQEAIIRKVYQDGKKKGFDKIANDKKVKDPEWEAVRVLNFFHYFMVDMLAGERWEKRKDTIQKWMDEDEAKDLRLNEARLTAEPKCEHCGKTGLRIVSKDLMHKGKNYDNEEVLFMLECLSCSKRTAVWQDGKLWEHLKKLCPRCATVFDETSKRTKKMITTTYTCPKCGYNEKDTLDLSFERKKEKPDPYWEKDKKRFVLTDEQGQKHLESKRNLEDLRRLMDDIKERDDNKELYEAVSSINKVNIGQLTDTLTPAIEKAGYKELSFEKPEIGKDVFVGFSCLDGKSDRAEYDSRKVLKKTVEGALSETNWRLMSDGISYRLGYLSGRLRAYEREEDLVGLVERDKKIKRKPNKDTNKNAYTIKDRDGRDIIL